MKSSFSLILLFLYFVHGLEAISVLTKHHVYIYSDLSRDIVPLLYHCKSGDTDFGKKSLLPGQSFHWNFKSNIFSTTVYTCDFQWGPRKKGFDVFDASWKNIHNTYNYVVKDDGFYGNFDPDDHEANLEFLYKWEKYTHSIIEC